MEGQITRRARRRENFDVPGISIEIPRWPQHTHTHTKRNEINTDLLDHLPDQNYVRRENETKSNRWRNIRCMWHHYSELTGTLAVESTRVYQLTSREWGRSWISIGIICTAMHWWRPTLKWCVQMDFFFGKSDNTIVPTLVNPFLLK